MDGYVVIGTEVDTKNFDAEIKYIKSKMEEIEYKLKQADMGIEVGDTEKLEAQYSRLGKQLDNLVKKQEDINRIDLSNAEKNIDKIGNSISGVIKKIGKWTLAIFGIRSAYNAIRGAISTLSQYNDQLATDVEYIRFALATTLEPIITKIIQLVYTLLQYVGKIFQSLFGINIFANAGANNFKKMNKSASQLRKTLAGFDEMNILNDDGSTGVLGGMPSMDLSNIGDVDLSGIKNLSDKIIEIFDNAFNTIKDNVENVLIDIGASDLFIKAWETTVEGIKQIFDGLLEFIFGFFEIIFGLFTGNTELVKDGIKKLINGIKDMFLGLIKTIDGVFSQIVASIRDIFLALVNWLYNNAIKPLGNLFSNLWKGVKDGAGSAVDWVKDKFNSMIGFFNGLISKIVGFFKDLGTKVGDVIGSAFKVVINGVLSSIENILNSPIRAINKLIDVINAIPGINLGKLYTFNLPRLAKGGVINMPGRGVMVGGAIAGERGQEGVIPLTDSQQMELLGQTIGKYISLNATIPVYVGNRQIAREIKNINMQNEFAYNK